MNNSVFPLIDVFDPPFDNDAILDARYSNSPNPFFKDIAIKQGEYDGLVIQDHYEAAKYVSQIGVNSNRISNYIEDQLRAKFNRSTSNMPSSTPQALKDYQQCYPSYSCGEVNTEINRIGCVLSEGQILFHGGYWGDLNAESLITNRPLSTSFCPQVAISNAVHKGKAYDSGRIDLFVLRVTNPRTNVFLFKQRGNVGMKHEKEVLFASGAKLTLRDHFCANPNYPVSRPTGNGYAGDVSRVPVYILEIEIS